MIQKRAAVKSSSNHGAVTVKLKTYPTSQFAIRLRGIHPRITLNALMHLGMKIRGIIHL